MEGCSGVRSSSSERFTADFMNIDSFQIQIYFQAFCLLSNSQPCSVRPVPGAHMLWGRQSDRNGCGLLAVPLSSRLHYVCDWDITYLYWGTPDTAAYLWEYMHAGPGGLRTPAITEASAPAKGTLLNGGETAFWMKLALHSAATIRNWCPSYCNIFPPIRHLTAGDKPDKVPVLHQKDWKSALYTHILKCLNYKSAMHFLAYIQYKYISRKYLLPLSLKKA